MARPAAADTAASQTTADSERSWQPMPAHGSALWRATTATALLAAVVIGWAAFPLTTGKPGTRAALIAAIVTGVLSVAQLAVSAVRGLAGEQLSPLHERAAERLLNLLRLAPWAEGMLLAVLALEALHPVPPWHTALLGVALLAFLFAVHLAETGAAIGVLRRQAPLIAAGIGLLVLAIGAGTLPALPSGPASTLVRVIAIVAAVLVSAIAVPIAVRGGRR